MLLNERGKGGRASSTHAYLRVHWQRFTVGVFQCNEIGVQFLLFSYSSCCSHTVCLFLVPFFLGDLL